MQRDHKIYFETAEKVSVIEGVDNIKEFMEDRAYLAKTMGYDAIIVNDMLQIFDEGELYGTYFQHKHMN
jgi:hypothetical protein